MISVIMPTFNSSLTVERSIRAVLRQGYRDLELIVCDDGSTDATLEIARYCEHRDRRVWVLAGPHLGVSCARNRGLDAAHGEYIAFADSDDLPQGDWLESMLAGFGKSDLSVCGYVAVDEQGKRILDTSGKEDAVDQPIKASEFLVSLFSNDRMYQGYVWNKLFSRKLLNDGDAVRFRGGVAYNEDRLFVFRYLLRCSSVSFQSRPAYVYTQRKNRSPYRPMQATELSAFDEILESIDRAQVSTDVLEQVRFYAEKDCFRAAVELFRSALEEGDPDALWLGERVSELSAYASEFSDYPLEFQERVREAVRATLPSS